MYVQVRSRVYPKIWCIVGCSTHLCQNILKNIRLGLKGLLGTNTLAYLSTNIFKNKLEYLTLASISTPIKYMQVRPRVYPKLGVLQGAFSLIGSSLNPKCKTRLKKLAWEEH
jgi:hypothetical protein